MRHGKTMKEEEVKSPKCVLRAISPPLKEEENLDTNE